MPYMYALQGNFQKVKLPYMYASYVCLYVCLICMPYMYAVQGNFQKVKLLPDGACLFTRGMGNVCMCAYVCVCKPMYAYVCVCMRMCLFTRGMCVCVCV